MQRSAADNNKADLAPLVKPRSNNAAPSGSRSNWLIPSLAATLMVVMVVFFSVGQSANQSNPLKVLFKDCGAVCKTQKQHRVEKFGGDVLDGAQLLSLVSAARDKAIQNLKLDYGEKYFSEIFEEKKDGKMVIRKAYVPAKSAVSTEKFKRKLQIKVLQVQTALRTQEKVEFGCDCAAEKPTTSFPKPEGKGQLRGLQENTSSISETDALAKFVWTTGGHSAAAGHGNLYNESYTAYMERAVKDVFASVGVDFIGKNYAMGGMISAPEIALCAETIFGSDTDAVSWDYGMTDGGNSPWTFRMFMYNNRASLIPSRPVLFGNHINMGEQQQIYSYFEENGLAGFLFDPDTEKKMHDAVPDSLGLSTEQLSALPPLVRNFKCDGKIESGEPYCDTEKYTNELCTDRKHKASWHPGWKEQALFGNAMALFLMESLVEAVSDLASKSGDPGQMLDELKALEDADYEGFMKSSLPESLWGALDKAYGELEKVFAEVNQQVFFRGPSMCHTALLPAESRYLGHLTESDKKGMFDYDIGIARPEIEATPPKEKNTSPMRLAFEPGFRQTCPVPLTVDFKDFFYTTRADGWTTLTVPNDAEAKAYRYDSSKFQGVIMVCMGTCDWGRCEEGDLKSSDLTEGKASLEVNGKPVKSIVQFANCFLLNGEGGLKWTPNSEGKFVLRAQVNVDKSYLRLSSVILV